MQSFGSVPDLTPEVLGINNLESTKIKKCQSIPNLDISCQENGEKLIDFKKENNNQKVNKKKLCQFLTIKKLLYSFKPKSIF